MNITLYGANGAPNINLGQYTEDPVASDGQISMTFTNGDICNGTELYQSVVTFQCDPSQGVGIVFFLGTSYDPCVYNFQWNTKYACSPAQSVVPCSLVDWATNKYYDLSPLQMFA
jgi:hypothetical protein